MDTPIIEDVSVPEPFWPSCPALSYAAAKRSALNVINIAKMFSEKV